MNKPTNAHDPERKRRLRLVSAVFPAVVGFLLLTVGQADIYVPTPFGVIYPVFFVILGGAAAIISVAAVALIYLQTGFSGSTPDDRPVSNVRARNLSDNPIYQELVSEISDIHQELADLKEEFKARSDQDEFAANDLSAILTARAMAISADDLINKADHRLDDRLRKLHSYSSINDVFEASRGRLRAEIQRLDWKSNFNLMLGGVSTGIGLGILAYSVFYKNVSATDMQTFIMALAPRLSIVLLIQVFSFFFLRLYRDSLSEIKYFQNEITNVEHRQIALNAATRHEADENVLELLAALLAIDRNHVLKKGDTTIELERAKLEMGANNMAFETLSKLIPLMKSK